MNRNENYEMLDYLVDGAVFLRKYTIVQATKSILVSFCTLLLLKKGVKK
mgnify:CR=1 FL=1